MRNDALFLRSSPSNSNSKASDGRAPISRYHVFKRGLDLLGAVAMFPAFASVALVLLCLNPFFNAGPLFFVQKRMGLNGAAFPAIKFRSMLPAPRATRGAFDPLETDRITTMGEILRKTHLDELPQILNVFAGHMSLVGPRPDAYDHALEFVRLVPGYRERCTVKPGITGLAQVARGYAAGFDAVRAKARTDLVYARKACLGLDLRILWLTALIVIGVRAE